MRGIKKIMYDCRRATLLIEKKHLGKISVSERVELKIHLAGCVICRIFQQQSLVINHMVKELINNPDKHSLHLDDSYKKQMQQRIEEEIDNS